MTQPTFVPVTPVGEVRPSMHTPPAEISRPQKVGLVRSAHPLSGAHFGTPAPDAGYAMGLAARALHEIAFESEHDRHDVELGVALLAAKRASLVGRAPTRDDVSFVLGHFELKGTVTRAQARPFAGLAHSYFAQRRFVDTVDEAALRPREVVTRY